MQEYRHEPITEKTNENSTLTPSEAVEILVILVNTLDYWKTSEIKLLNMYIGRLARYRPEEYARPDMRYMVRPE